MTTSSSPIILAGGGCTFFSPIVVPTRRPRTITSSDGAWVRHAGEETGVEVPCTSPPQLSTTQEAICPLLLSELADPQLA
eukprot:1271726-Pyramimonas_sp.AAC.1